MIIFLYGPDSYRSKQKLDEIVAHYKAAKPDKSPGGHFDGTVTISPRASLVGKSGLSLIYVDAASADFQGLYGWLKISSMFAETKLAIVKSIFSQKKFQEDFLEELSTLEQIKDVVVVYETGEVDQRLKLFKELIKKCKCQEFTALDVRQLKAWAGKEFKARGCAINADALDMLVSYVGNDLWRLSGEVKKLADYQKGPAVKRADVELMVRPRIENDIFKTIDALAQKNKKQALALIQKHIDAGEAPLYVLSMIAWQFKNLLVVKELAERGLMYASIVKKSGLHPFVVKKNYYICSQFSFEELKFIYRKIFEVDTQIKTGLLEPELALDLLVTGI